MNRFAKMLLVFLSAAIVFLSIAALQYCFAGNGASVTDNGEGNTGYILINDGSGQGHRGTWVNPTTVPSLKGDKGDQGIQGIQGLQGLQGIAGLNGKDGLSGINGINGIDGNDGYTPIKGVDYFDGLNGIDGYTPIKGVDYFDGLNGTNGLDGKDVDPVTVTNLQNTDITLQNNLDTEATIRFDADALALNNVNREATARLNSDNYLNNRIDDTNTRINEVSSRVSKLERTQFVLETSFRILDTQRISLRPFFRQNFTAGKIDVIGLRIDVKLGKSYEEKLIAKVNARLDAIEKTIGKAPVIEKVVDEKGNVRSIRINGQGLTVTSQF